MKYCRISKKTINDYLDIFKASTIKSYYDAWGQLVRESQKEHTSGDSIITVYAYLPSGLLDYQLRNGAITDYTYDRLNRVQQVSLFDAKTNQTTAQSYTYDQWDRVVQIKDSVDGKVFITGTAARCFGQGEAGNFPERVLRCQPIRFLQ